MAWIKKRPQCKDRPWQLCWRDSLGKRHHLYYGSEAEAKDKMAELRHRMRNQREKIIPSALAFGEFLGARLAARKEDGSETWEFTEGAGGWFERQAVQPSTRRAWKVNFLRHVLPCFGHSRLQDIEAGDVYDFLRKRRGTGLSTATVGGLYRLLHLVFADAAMRKILTVNPAASIPKDKRKKLTKQTPKHKRTRNNIWFGEESQVNTFVKKAVEMFPAPSPWGAFLALVALSGLRESEALGLCWRDLALERDSAAVSVRQSWDRDGVFTPLKSEHAARDIPLLPDARRALLAWKLSLEEKDKADDRRVFPFMGGAYRKALKAILAAEPGLPRVSLHGLRHSFASYCANRGVALKRLAGWMGHGSVSLSADYYAGRMGGDQDIVREKLAGIGGVGGS